MPVPELPTALPAVIVNDVPVAAPMLGVTSVGVLANTSDPVPVSSVTAEIRLADEGVASQVAMPVPSPLIPLLTGNPVQFVSVPDVGVPKTGVVNCIDVAAIPLGSVELIDGTPAPDVINTPLLAVARPAMTLVPELYSIWFAVVDDRFVPPLATGNMPVTPVVSGNPVPLVNPPANCVAVNVPALYVNADESCSNPPVPTVTTRPAVSPVSVMLDADSVTPLIVPPVMITALGFWLATPLNIGLSLRA